MKQEVNVVRYFDGLAGIRAAAVNIKEPLKDIVSIQNCGPVAVILLGRALAGAALLASQMEEEETISLYFKGDGPMESIFAEATYDGTMRGYTPVPSLHLPVLAGKIDLPIALGQGNLTVVRAHPKRKIPHKGTVEIVSGEIGDEVALYLHQSEQRPAYVSVGVKLNSDFEIVSAGGVMMEVMPEVSESVAIQLESNATKAPSVTEVLAKNADLEELMKPYFKGFQMQKAEHPFGLRFHCPCTKDRLIRSMDLFDEADLEDIVEKQETTSARCEFCGRHYELAWTDVKDIKDKRHRTGLH